MARGLLSTSTDCGIDAVWELDLFGKFPPRVRRRPRAETGEARAAPATMSLLGRRRSGTRYLRRYERVFSVRAGHLAQSEATGLREHVMAHRAISLRARRASRTSRVWRLHPAKLATLEAEIAPWKRGERRAVHGWRCCGRDPETMVQELSKNRSIPSMRLPPHPVFRSTC